VIAIYLDLDLDLDLIHMTPLFRLWRCCTTDHISEKKSLFLHLQSRKLTIVASDQMSLYKSILKTTRYVCYF
jgi:hypothetical protein